VKKNISLTLSDVIFAIANKHGDYFRVFVVSRFDFALIMHRLSPLAKVGDNVAVATRDNYFQGGSFFPPALSLSSSEFALNRIRMIIRREMTSEPTVRGSELIPEIV